MHKSSSELSASAPLSLSRLSKGQRIDYGEIAEVFMAAQTHNDTVMAANLTKMSKKRSRVCVYLCARCSTDARVKGQAWEKSQGGLLLAIR